MVPKVKICGITQLDDALAAVRSGADALGFVFYSGSSRYVDEQTAGKIISVLPPFVAKVGVFVNASGEAVRKIVQQCGIDTVQFHGEEPPELCRVQGAKTIKAFRVRDAQSLEGIEKFGTDAWLLDAYVPGQLGGTGAVCDWSLAVRAVQFGRPIILAGGLTPENVRDAIRQVQPYGVDVSSGVEIAPGKKDHEKLARFIAAAKGISSGRP